MATSFVLRSWNFLDELRRWSSVGTLGILCLSGCVPDAMNSTASNTPAATAPANPAPSAAAAPTISGIAGVDLPGAAAPAAAKPAEPAPPPPVVAAAGVAKQGQSLNNEKGIGRMIAQPAITLFTVRERAVFEIQIPQAMNLFEASEGRKPKSHDEFMAKIINANQIKLPELPAGKTYQYHPDDSQLYVHSE